MRSLAFGFRRRCLRRQFLIQIRALFLHVSASIFSFLLSKFAESAILVMLLNRIGGFLGVSGSAVGSVFNLFAGVVCPFRNFVFLCFLFCEFFGFVHFLTQADFVGFLFDFGCTPVEVADASLESCGGLLLKVLNIISFFDLFVGVRWVKLLLVVTFSILRHIEVHLVLLPALLVQRRRLGESLALRHGE